MRTHVLLLVSWIQIYSILKLKSNHGEVDGIGMDSQNTMTTSKVRLQLRQISVSVWIGRERTIQEVDTRVNDGPLTLPHLSRLFDGQISRISLHNSEEGQKLWGADG
jgi:hypothetical protein